MWETLRGPWATRGWKVVAAHIQGGGIFQGWEIRGKTLYCIVWGGGCIRCHRGMICIQSGGGGGGMVLVRIAVKKEVNLNPNLKGYKICFSSLKC